MWKRELPLIVIGIAVVALIQGHYPQKRLKDSIVFGFNEEFVSYTPEFLRLTSFGYSRAMSSLLWIQFLQQTPPARVEPDKLSWIYYDLEAVTEIDPNFLPAYDRGGIFLSVVTEDKRGAERILLKGSKRFPDQWRLPAYLAYHYQWELNEPEKAEEQYLLASTKPNAPYLVMVRAASATARREGVGPALELLRGFLENTQEPAARERILAKIKSLKEKKK